MRRLALALVLTASATLLGAAAAQNLAETIRGLYGENLGTAITSRIPGYGTHAVIGLTTVQLTPAEARDLAAPVFAAIARQIGGTVSASIFGQADFGSDPYELVFQLIDDDILVFLDGERFDP